MTRQRRPLLALQRSFEPRPQIEQSGRLANSSGGLFSNERSTEYRSFKISEQAAPERFVDRPPLLNTTPAER